MTVDEDGPMIDGLYLDGIAYDRTTFQRLRRAVNERDLTKYPSVLFDFHTGETTGAKL